jgi:4'-phosphopantetheinyl transferase
VWQASLDGGADAAVLSAAEAERAERARTEAARARAVRARWLLRSVLAGYVGAAPGELRFGEAESGKPHLRGAGSLSFNLSHAGARWALAVCGGGAVGIDVERADRLVDADAVARRVFAPGERRAVSALEGPARRAAFFRYWAAREALVKGLGTRLLLPGTEFEIEARPGGELAARAADGGELGWWLAELPVPPPWIGVLAVEAPPSAVRCFGIRA